MSTNYYTPQRVVTGHITRFLRRAADSTGSIVPAAVEIHAWFNPQLLAAGEREPVYAQFAAGTAWSAESGTFTLWAAGTPAAGYDAIAATLSSDSSGRLFTAAATIDLTAEADYPLEGGIYQGEFLVTTSTGKILAARGCVTIVTPGALPDDYQTGGGLD